MVIDERLNVERILVCFVSFLVYYPFKSINWLKQMLWRKFSVNEKKVDLLVLFASHSAEFDYKNRKKK